MLLKLSQLPSTLEYYYREPKAIMTNSDDELEKQAQNAVDDIGRNDCSSDDDDEGDDDDDDNFEDEDTTYYALCCRNPGAPGVRSFSSLSEALQSDRADHNFDILDFLPSPSDEDFFERAILCINMSRKYVTGLSQNDEKDIGSKLKNFLKSNLLSSGDEYYKPSLADDSFLMALDDFEDLKNEQERNGGIEDDVEKDLADANEPKTLQELEKGISSLQEQLHRAKELIALLTIDDGDDEAVAQSRKMKQDNDTYYFSSYSSHYIHETMLKDTVRTAAYEKAILSNADSLFKNKIVLDIGCGTGVLSIFAAKAGARKVIAVDASTILEEAQNIINLNGFGGVIHCCQGMLEKLIEKQELPLEEGEKVDIIVSEWMGYGLFFETMLPSVMKARDSVMASTGTMFPNACQIFLEGATDDRLDYWSDVHGIDMTPMKARVARELVKDAGVEVVDGNEISTNRAELIGYDLNSCQDADLDFSVPFELIPKFDQGNSDVKEVRVDKLVLSFDIDFNLPGTNAVSFSTGCQSTPTHWKQTVLWFDPLAGIPKLGRGEVLRGNIKMGRNHINHRDMDFDVVWEAGMASESEEFVRRSGGRITTQLLA